MSEKNLDSIYKSFDNHVSQIKRKDEILGVPFRLTLNGLVCDALIEYAKTAPKPDFIFIDVALKEHSATWEHYRELRRIMEERLHIPNLESIIVKCIEQHNKIQE
jgi:hypothetical protein